MYGTYKDKLYERIDWLGKSITSHQTQNRSFQRRSSQPISWLSTEKLKQTQQKQTWIHKKYTTT